MNSNHIQKYRQQAGISQTKLACKIGIAASTLSAFERGRVEPWPKVRKAIAKALGVKEIDLFGNKKESTAVSLTAPAALSGDYMTGGDPDHAS